MAPRAFLVARTGPDAHIREVEPGTNGYEYDKAGAVAMAARLTTKRTKTTFTRTGRIFFTGLDMKRREVTPNA